MKIRGREEYGKNERDGNKGERGMKDIRFFPFSAPGRWACWACALADGSRSDDTPHARPPHAIRE